MENLLTTPEAAAMLNVRPQTLEVWRTRGIGPEFVKVRRLVRYRRSDLEAFIRPGRGVRVDEPAR